MRVNSWKLCALAAGLVLAACGGGDDDAGGTAVDESAATADTAVEPAAEPADDAADDDAAGDDAAGDDAPGDDAAGDEPAADEPAAGANIARVTIDGTTHEIDVSLGLTPRCDPDFFAAFWAAGGDQDGTFYALLPPPDDPNHTDPPNVSLRLNDGEFEWIADPSKQMSGVEPGESQVDEFSVEGNTARGTATFVELNETFAHSGGGPKARPVIGTFEVTCPG